MNKLHNILMQLRKNCNHPDIITSEWEQSQMYPSADELVCQGGKMQLLERLLKRLRAGGHKVLIFSQARSPCLLVSFPCIHDCGDDKVGRNHRTMFVTIAFLSLFGP
jgi:hypothetical protein